MHLDVFKAGPGPDVPELDYQEMEEQDLRNEMAYLHIALTHAVEKGLDEAMTEVLTTWYDKAFTTLAASSERFRQAVIRGAVFPPGGPPVRAKYLGLVKKASES